MTTRLREERWSEGVEYLNPDEIARDRFGDWNSPEAVLAAARWTEARRGEGGGRSGAADAEAFLQHEVLGAFGEPLGDDLSVERVREDLRPLLEGAIGRDAGRTSVVVALGDDLEGELGLGGVHREDGEVVDDEELGADVGM